MVAFGIYFGIAIAATRMQAELGPPAYDLHNGRPDYILGHLARFWSQSLFSLPLSAALTATALDDPNAGSPYPWEKGVPAGQGVLNTENGNLQIPMPLTGYHGRGLSVGLSFSLQCPQQWHHRATGVPNGPTPTT